MMRYMKKVVATFMAAVLLMGTIMLPAFAALEEGVVFQHQKTGIETIYLVLPDGTAALGDGEHAAVPMGTTKLVIPANVTYFEAWENVHPYGVSSINTNAFLGCDALKEIYIEGDVFIQDGALGGLSKDVRFTIASDFTKQSLISCGIPEENITYRPIQTKYVAFGDSIAAGYALDEYKINDMTTIQGSDGDRFPTPADAFVNKVGETFKEQGETVLDNQAVSGWTSTQLLEMLQSGAYDATLKDADVLTVTIGSNDLLGPFMEIVADAIRQEFGDEGAEEAATTAENDMFRIHIPMIIQSKIEDVITSIGKVTANLNDALADNAVLNQACVDFKETVQPAILEELSARAPEAEIYWTTLYNPFYGVKLDLLELFPGLEMLKIAPEATQTIETIELGALGAQYVEKMNEAFTVNTEGYTIIPLYEAFNNTGLTNVNISRDAGLSMELLPDDTLNFQLDPHPNTDGHQLIYDIVMPTIQNSYAPENKGFEDVKETDWFYEDVIFAVDKGWMNGVSKDSFAPNRIVSRAVIATVLWRLAGEPQIEGIMDFEDVKIGEWYEKAVAWASSVGITNGYGEGIFGTNDSVSREQLVAFLYRYAEKHGYDVSNGTSLADFTDGEKVSDYAKNAMEWAVGKGIISGKGDKMIDPKGTATAAEIAAILRRFFEGTITPETEETIPEDIVESEEMTEEQNV